MLAGGIGIGLGVDLGKCNPDLGELGMTIANRGTCQPWHDLAYLPRGPREPNAPSRAKSRQLTCHLPDVVHRDACRRWLRVVFESPRRLNLQLVCTAKTRGKDRLDISLLIFITHRPPPKSSLLWVNQHHSRIQG